MADKAKKRYSAAEVLEAIFDDEDSLDDQFDCGSDVEMIPDSADSSSDSDLDLQISQIISNLEQEDNGIIITHFMHMTVFPFVYIVILEYDMTFSLCDYIFS